MDKEAYVEGLEILNGYCDCPCLQDLFRLRRTTDSSGKAYCQRYAEADTATPRPDDRRFLLKCQDQGGDFIARFRAYHRVLTEAIGRGIVAVQLHEDFGQGLKPTRKVAPAEIEALVDSGRILTTHCSSCNQQIDILVKQD